MMHNFILGAFIAAQLLVPISFAQAAEKTAVLKLTTPSTSVTPGSEVTASLFLLPGGQAVIGTKIAIYFSPKLAYVSFDATGSVFNTEIDEATVNDNTLTFSRVDMNNSYAGTEGLIGKVTFIANELGRADISIQETLTEVKADSDLTNILLSSQPTYVTVSAPASSPVATVAPTAAAVTTPTPTPLTTATPTPKPTATTTPAPTTLTTATATPATTVTTVTPKATVSPKNAAAITPTNSPQATQSTPTASITSLVTHSPDTSPTTASTNEPSPNPTPPLTTAKSRAAGRAVAVVLLLLGTVGATLSIRHLRGRQL